MAAVGPVTGRERIIELDILRGVALFGVLTMNFVAFASAHIMATEAQLAALPTAAIDRYALLGVEWLIGDKANTMFATLFGLGFYLQMKRGEGRPGFEKRYSRRLFWLLMFGWANALLLWMWDILNLYAVAGFALLAMRNWRTRTLVIFGAVAALYSEHLQSWWTEAIGWQLIPYDQIYSDAAVLERQAAIYDYPALVAVFWKWTWADWVSGGLMIAWLIYALGRFALGAAIGRSGILDDVSGHLPLLRRIAVIALPLGLLFALTVRLWSESHWDPFGMGEGTKQLGDVLRSPAALLLAAGYASAIVVGLHRGWGTRFWRAFAPVGQMALTNYLVQGFIYGFVLFGVGPGLALAGKIGTSTVVIVCVAFFAAQMAFSHWWLARFRFGPMEWLWRTLTYGERPAMRRISPLAATA
jgi:uncharacterized protein